MNRFLDAVLRRCRERPGANFCHIVAGGVERSLNWGEIALGAAGYARALREAGVAPGGVVLIFLRHGPALYCSFLGAMLSGAVPSFMPCASPRQDPTIYWDSHRRLLAHIEPAAIILERRTLAEMRNADLPIGRYPLLLAEDLPAAGELPSAMPSEDSIALLQHSSGTTGLKKGVALSYRAIADQLDSYGRAIGIGTDDRIASWLPLYHDMGLVACFLLPIYYGVPFVHLDALEWVMQPLQLLDAIARHRGTLVWQPNFAFDHLVNARRDEGRRDLSSVRAFINCSEPCRPDTFERFQRAFAASGVRRKTLQSCYGMAETAFAVTQTPPDSAWRERRFESRRLMNLGPPIDGVELSIRNASGREAPEGEIGEIAIRGRFLFSGYHHDAGLTAKRMSGGWYLSRDLGCMIDGELYVAGRADDLLVVNGRKLHASEIEALLDDGGVKPGRAAAFALYDERSRSNGLIVVAERDAGTALADDEIVGRIVDRIRSTVDIQPRTVRLVRPGWVVKTTSGKIARGENLRKYLAERAPAEETALG
jgi:fatty-acyl-CoA synthase